MGYVLANILGTIEAEGIEVICFDRLIHEAHERRFEEWSLARARTTLLSRLLKVADLSS
jgi:ABC-type xylose transport system substrate-binding protein